MSVALAQGMRTTALFAATAISLFGCAGGAESEDPEDSIFIDDGKADDFFSTSAREYILQGSTSVTLDAAMASRPVAERLAAAKLLISQKQIALAWFVTQYLVDKEHDASNAGFGGMGGMAKAG